MNKTEFEFRMQRTDNDVYTMAFMEHSNFAHILIIRKFTFIWFIWKCFTYVIFQLTNRKIYLAKGYYGLQCNAQCKNGSKIYFWWDF